MKAVAIKKGQSREKAAGFREMGTLRCDGCGEEFVIAHRPAFVDKWVADQQASGVTSKPANGGHFKTGQRKVAWD